MSEKGVHSLLHGMALRVRSRFGVDWTFWFKVSPNERCDGREMAFGEILETTPAIDHRFFSGGEGVDRRPQMTVVVPQFQLGRP